MFETCLNIPHIQKCSTNIGKHCKARLTKADTTYTLSQQLMPQSVVKHIGDAFSPIALSNSAGGLACT